MPFYKYKYVKEGEEKEETKEFADKASLYSAVRLNEGSILSVEEIGGKKVNIKLFSFTKKVKTQEVIMFAKNLSVMVDAGLSVSRALNILEKQLKNKRSHDLSRCDCIGDGGHRSSPYGLYGADVNRNL